MINRYDHGWKRGGFCRRILPPKSLWLVGCSSSSAGIKRKMPQPWFKLLGIPVFPSKSSGFNVKFVMSHPIASKCKFEIESKLQKCYSWIDFILIEIYYEQDSCFLHIKGRTFLTPENFEFLFFSWYNYENEELHFSCLSLKGDLLSFQKISQL